MGNLDVDMLDLMPPENRIKLSKRRPSSLEVIEEVNAVSFSSNRYKVNPNVEELGPL